MQITQITVTELRDKFPKRFEEEYHDWLRYMPDANWTEYVREQFAERHTPQGVDVENINYNVGGGQRGYAVFDGYVNAWLFMKHMKLDEKYLPLYLAVCDDGSQFRVHATRRGNLDVVFYATPWETSPSGVFSTLDDAAWEELVQGQMIESQLDTLVEDFCNDICHTLYKELEAEYDALTSEEEFIASCEANEITFEIDTGEEE